MTYALQLDKPGPPALVLEGEFFTDADGTSGKFIVLSVGRGVDWVKVGDVVFIMKLPDARKVHR